MHKFGLFGSGIVQWLTRRSPLTRPSFINRRVSNVLIADIHIEHRTIHPRAGIHRHVKVEVIHSPWRGTFEGGKLRHVIHRGYSSRLH